MGVNFLQTRLFEFSLDKDLRFDHKFYDFVLRNNFEIIPGGIDTIRLRYILVPNYKKLEYQEDQEYKGLPTAAEYYNENGDIINTQVVTKDEAQATLLSNRKRRYPYIKFERSKGSGFIY